MAVLLWGSCGTPPARTALEVIVTIAPGAKSACVIVTAGDQRTEAIALSGKTELKVGVVKTAAMPITIPVAALGYSDAQCLTRIVPTEQSAAQDATFENNAVVQVQLLLEPVVGPVDGDGDGYSPPDDCKDDNRAVHPGAPELCGNGIDDDCDFLTDCADDTCSGQSCGSGAVCGGGACRETVCDDGFDNDGNQGADCPDPDCNTLPCINGGTCNNGACTGASSEVGLCYDGLDNDGDTKFDCFDPDCMGNPCSDSNACSTGETCVGTVCMGGTAVSCNPVAPTCYLPSSGVCQPADGGCTWAPSPADAGCNDSNLCTVNDVCNGDGGCAGTPKVCSAPSGVCFASIGACQSADGGCAYAPIDAGQGSCNDLDNCTLSDRCDGDGGCRGTPVACTPGPCQTFVAGSCSDAGTCIYTPVAVGTACTGGKCNPQQTCVPAPSWPYTPKNFMVNQLPTASDTVTIDCTGAAIRTSLAQPYAVFEGWCTGRVQPGFYLPPGVSTTSPVVFSMLGLTVTSGNRLRVYGERPVVFAVQGDVLISGVLEAGARADIDGAGGEVDCPGSSKPAGGACDSAPICGGGGGAGYGGAGRDGGLGESGNTSPGGALGASWGTIELVPLVGGCRGAAGGAGATVDRAAGGGAGGAVQISATGTITVNDRISSVGGGGRDPAQNTSRGGGGGGSGGAILLEANQFTQGGSAWISCNGGAGGEGSDGNSNPSAGADGDDNSSTAAAGGNSTNNGGTGGDGQTSTAAPTSGGNGASGSEHGGGGGGGAGLGRVRINVVTTCSLPAGRITAVASSNRPDAGCP